MNEEITKIKKRIEEIEEEISKCITDLGNLDFSKEPNRVTNIVEKQNLLKKKLNNLKKELDILENNDNATKSL